jgi:hypothetical protein
MYQKVGKFGDSGSILSTNENFGDQVRGFGFMRDGNMDTLDSFLQGDVFLFGLDTATNNRKRGQVVDFVMVMDSDLAPIVGQQVTLNELTGTDTDARIELLIARAEVAPNSECDLIVKGVIEEEARGFFLNGAETFQSDRQSESYSYQQLRDLAKSPDGALTFTCVPPGSGNWMGIDRNRDGVLTL